MHIFWKLKGFVTLIFLGTFGSLIYVRWRLLLNATFHICLVVESELISYAFILCLDLLGLVHTSFLTASSRRKVKGHSAWLQKYFVIIQIPNAKYYVETNALPKQSSSHLVWEYQWTVPAKPHSPMDVAIVVSCLCMDAYAQVWWLYCICTEPPSTSKTIPTPEIIVLFFLAINFWAHFCLVSLDCNNSTIPVAFRLEPHLITGIQEYLHPLVILWRIFNITIQHDLLTIISV